MATLLRRPLMVAASAVVSISMGFLTLTVHTTDAHTIASSPVYRATESSVATELPVADLIVATSTVYRVADDGKITVQVDYTVTNVSREHMSEDGTLNDIRLIYFNPPVHPEASNIQTRVNGVPATFTQSEREDSWRDILRVEFEDALYPSETTKVTVTWDIASKPPRVVEGDFVRSSPAYVTFPLYTWSGNSQQVTVSVELDPSWKHDYIGSELTVGERDGLTTLTAADIPKQSDWWVRFAAERKDRYTSTDLKLDASTFTILSWPDDPEWKQHAEESIHKGIPALEATVSAPWPHAHTEIVETMRPRLYGYPGSHSTDPHRIGVGEALNRQRLLRQISRGWFNSATVRTSWVTEGIADYIAGRVAKQVWDDNSEPTTVADLDAKDVEYTEFPLNDWDKPLDRGDLRSRYGYAKSHEVVRDLAAEIGDEKMTELVGAITNRHRAYPGTGEPVIDDDGVDWREFLDLAEQAGSTKLAEQYATFIVNDSQRPLLNTRAIHLNAYNELISTGGGWVPPAGVRQAMADWHFEQAAERITIASEALDIKKVIATVLEPAGLQPSATTKSVYQDATGDLDRLNDTMQAHLEASTTVASAVNNLDEQLPKMGLTPYNFDIDTYNTDLFTTAKRLSSLDEQADRISANYTELAASVESYGGTTPVFAADSFTKNPDELTNRIADLATAAHKVEAAHAANADASSLLERIGAVGRPADSYLADAANKLTNGDNAGAETAAAQAKTEIQTFARAGKTRAGIGAGILVLVVFLAGGATIAHRRKKPTQSTDSPGLS